MIRISVYPVGLLMDLQYLRSSGDWRSFAHRQRHLLRWAQERNWRAIRNHFNGYLAEPHPFPPGVERCGTGWTRNRSLRDLNRRMP